MTTKTDLSARTFTTKSNANRAARNAGLVSWLVEGPNSDGEFVVVVAPQAEVIEGELIDETVIAECAAVDAAAEDAAETIAAETDAAPALAVQVGEHDLGVVPDMTAGEGQKLADEEGETVIVRDALTDAVLATYEPAERDLPPPATDAADAGAGETVEAGAEDEGTEGTTEEEETIYSVALSVTPSLMAEIARMMAKRADRPVWFKPEGMHQTVCVEPPRARAAKEPKAPTEKAPREPRAKKAAPEGKRAMIVEMCLRPTGASPKELFEATQWHGAPWKWLIQNPKGNGLADLYGYDLRAEKGADGARYYLTPKMAEAAE